MFSVQASHRRSDHGHRTEGETGMRGFLGGVSVGALVAVAGAAVWSLSRPLPQVVHVSDQTPETILAKRVEPTPPQDTPGSDADLVETAPEAPAQDAGLLDDAPDQIDTQSAARPEVTVPDEDAAQISPDEGAGTTPDVQVASDASVETTPGGEGLDTPTADVSPDVVEDSAQPPAPTPTEEPVLAAPDVELDVPAVDGASGNSEAPLQLDEAAIQPPTINAAPEITAPPSVMTPQPTPTPQVGSDDSASEDEDLDLSISELPQAGTDTAEDEGPSIGTRVLPLTERDAAQESATADQEPPFRRNAEPADPAPGLPLMSIILIEEEGAVGAEALEAFPYPLTFAIDPSDPQAEERMAARRAAGFEVLVLADLSRDATPQDAEVALPVWFDRLPEVVGVLEGNDGGVQGNRPLADQVATIAADLGYGLVLQDNGLNTVQKMALRDGNPAGVVFRDFDGAGQDPRAMRRFLDQAAFRSGQEGAVIMLGRLKPDTISALLIWGLQDRASRVELVPVSTSLKRLLDPISQ